jgi:predicted DNA-binding ribbon-helix-helix protein
MTPENYRLQKRSMRINGRATSVRLEVAFWAALERRAAAAPLTLATLVSKIELDRRQFSPNASLASSLRLFAIGDRIAEPMPQPMRDRTR